MKPLLVIGGMNMDILGIPSGIFQWGDSLPGRIQLRPGGVGRNIAAELARLGAPVELLTALGDDPFSEMLRRDCLQRGIGLTYAVSYEGPASLYMAIHQQQGEMVAAVNHMDAVQKLSPEWLLRLPAEAFSVCVLDANVKVSVLEAAAKHLRAPLVADPVSGPKAVRLRPILHRLTALKPNLTEARHLTGEEQPEESARALRGMGVQQVYVSLGAGGLYCAADGFEACFSPTRPSTRPATGAGDAMTAGIAWAVARGMPPRAAARLGLESASDHLENS